MAELTVPQSLLTQQQDDPLDTLTAPGATTSSSELTVPESLLGGDRTGVVLEEALTTSPDQYKKDLDLTTPAGVSPELLEGDDGTFKRHLQGSALRKKLRDAEFTNEWFGDLKNAKLAHDDVDTLTAIENALVRGGLRVGQGYQQFQAEETSEQAKDTERSFLDILNDQSKGSPTFDPIDLLLAGERYITSRLVDRTTKDAAANLTKVGELQKRIAETKMSEPATRARDAIMAAGKDGIMAALDAAAEDPLGTLAFAAEVGLEFTPQLAVGTAASTLTGPAGGALVMGTLSGLTERYASPAEFLTNKGVDLTDPASVLAAVDDPILMNEAAAYGYTRGVIIGALDFASAGLASKTFGGPVRNMLTQAGIQSGLGGAGEGFAQLATTGEIDAGEVVLEALGEFATTPIEVVGVGQQYLGDYMKTRRAQQFQGRVSTLLDMAQNSALRNRSPEAFEEYFQSLAERSGTQDILLNVQPLVENLRESGQDPVAFFESLGAPLDTIEKAFERGGDVRVPVGKFVTQLADSEYRDVVLTHVRENDGAQTLAEAEVRSEEITQQAERIAEEMKTGKRTEVDEITQFSDRLAQQAEESGKYDRRGAVQVASLYEALFRTVKADYETEGKTFNFSQFMDRKFNVRGVDFADRNKPVVDEAQIDEELLQVTGPEKLIRSAAVRYKGKTYKAEPGQHHRDITLKDGTAANETADVEFGYITKDGDFVDRWEAYGLAQAAGQLTEAGQRAGDILPMLLSEQVVYQMAQEFDVDPDTLRQELEAAGGDITQTPRFKEWFGDSKVVDADGKPLVVYHGSDSANQGGENFAFEVGRPGKRYTTFSQSDVVSSGVFLSPGKGDASNYGGNVGAYYAAIQNPLRDPRDAPISSRSSSDVKDAAAKAWDDVLYIFDPVIGKGDGVWQIDTDGGVSMAEVKSEDALMDVIFVDGMIEWHHLDEPEVVERMKERGYDGAKVYEPNDESGVSWFAADPTQIKSVFNRGTFDQNDPRILYQEVTDKLFRQDYAQWQQNAKPVIRKQRKLMQGEHTIVATKTAPVLRDTGLRNLPISMPSAKMLRVLDDHPTLTEGHLLHLPKLLADPAVVVDGTEKNSKIVVLNAKDSQKNLIVAVVVDGYDTLTGDARNVVKSVYPLDDPNDSVTRRVKAALDRGTNLEYAKTGEATLEVLRGSMRADTTPEGEGASGSTPGTSPRSPQNVRTLADVVKRYGQELYQSGEGLGRLYNPVEKVVQEMAIPAWKQEDGKARGADVAAKLKSTNFGPGVSRKSAIRWTGIEEFLLTDPEAKFTRQDVLDFLRQGGVRVEEVVAGGEVSEDGDALNWTRFVLDSDHLDASSEIDAMSENISESFYPNGLPQTLADLRAAAEDNYDAGEILEELEREGVLADNEELTAEAAQEIGPRPTAETQTLDMFEFHGEADMNAALKREQEDWDARLAAWIDKADASQADISRAIEDAVFEIAKRRYDENPMVRWTEENTGVSFTGNDDIGYYGDGVEEAYSANEAQIQAQDYIFENDLMPEGTRGGSRWGDYVTDGDHDNYREIKLTLPEIEGDFYNDAHFPDRNIVAFLRVTDRELPLGETTMPVDPADDEVAITGFGGSVETQTYGDLRRQLEEAKSARDEALQSRQSRRGILEGARDFLQGLVDGGKAKFSETPSGLRFDYVGQTQALIDMLKSAATMVQSRNLSEQEKATAQSWLDKIEEQAATIRRVGEINLTLQRAEALRLGKRNREINKKVFAVDEFQSDWHQHGRKYGYKKGLTSDEIAALKANAESDIDQGMAIARDEAKISDVEVSELLAMFEKTDLAGEALAAAAEDAQTRRARVDAFVRSKAVHNAVEFPTREARSEFFAEAKRLRSANPNIDAYFNFLESAARKRGTAEVETSRYAPPEAPFDGDDWMALGLKRALIEAAEGGYDAMAFANAEVLKERWSSRYAELYENQYDKKMPSIVKKLTGQEPRLVDLDGEPMDPPEQRETHIPESALNVDTSGVQEVIDEYARPQERDMTPEEAVNYREELRAWENREFKKLTDAMQARGMPIDYEVRYVPTADARFEIRTIPIPGERDAYILGEGMTLPDAIIQANLTIKTRPELVTPPAEEGWHVVDITPELREEILNNGFSLFQDGGQNPPPLVPGQPTPGQQPERLGSTQFGVDDSITVNLFENADFSTLLHESGHVFVRFLEDLAVDPEAPARIKDNYQAMLDWVGAKDASDLDASTDEGRARQEKLAEAFEAYLMEGKAPSAQLQSAFQMFKQWLLQVYKSLTSRRTLDVEIDDGIREVFDKMLATDAEIADMQAINGIGLGSAPSIAQLMTPQEYAEHSALQAQAADNAAEQKRLQERVAEQREDQKWWQDAFEKMKAAVEKDLYDRPEYRAFDYLVRGTFRKGETPQSMVNKRISKDALLELGYTKEDLKALPKGARAIYTTDPNTATDPTMMAAFLGFDSVDEMMTTLTSMTPAKDAIARDARFMMMEEFGDPMNDGTLERLTEEALYNDAQTKAIQMELDALATKTGQQPVAKKVIKAVVERIYDEQDVGDLLTPMKFQAAAVRAARDAERAAAAGDFQKAFLKKREHMLNHELFRKALKAKEEVDKITTKLRKYQTQTLDKNRYDPDHIAQIKHLLQFFEFGGKSETALRASLQKQVMEFIERQRALGEPVILPGDLVELVEPVSENNPEPKFAFKVKHWRRMTLTELRGLRDMAENLAKRARDTSAEAKEELKIANKERADNIRDKAAPRKSKEDTLAVPTRKQQEKQAKKGGFLAVHRKMESILRELDGFEELGPMYRSVMSGIADAQSAKTQMIEMLSKRVEEVFNRYDRAERWSFASEKSAVAIDALNGAKMTREQRLTLALNWGNETSREAVLEDRYMIDKFGAAWNAETVEEIIGTLDDRDLDVVEDIWDTVGMFWDDVTLPDGRVLPGIASLERQTTGVVPPRVQADPVVINGRTLKGGYYPLMYNDLTDARAARESEQDLMNRIQTGGFARAHTSHGFTNARVGSGGRAVRYDIGVLMRHMDEVTQDIAYRTAVSDAAKVIGSTDVQAAIRDTMGTPYLQALQEILVKTAGGNMTQTEAWTDATWLRTARLNVTTSVMGFNLRSILTQPMGLTQTWARIGFVDTVKGLAHVWGNPAKLRERVREIDAKSPYMQERAKMLTRELDDIVNRLDVPNVADDMRAFGFKPMVLMDVVAVAYPTWQGAYEKAMAGKVNGIDANEEADAIRYADMTVRTTQGSGGAQNLAVIQQSSELAKLMTMFYGYFNTTVNMQAEAYAKARQQGAGKLGAFANRHFIGQTLLLTLIPAVVSGLIMEAFPDDDELDDDPEKAWAKWTLAQIFSYATGQLVGVRDLGSAIVSGFDFGLTPVDSLGSGIGRVVRGLADILEWIEEGEVPDTFVKNFARTVGMATGVPGSNQAVRTADYLIKLANDDLKREPEDAFDIVKGALLTGDR